MTKRRSSEIVWTKIRIGEIFYAIRKFFGFFAPVACLGKKKILVTGW